MGKPVRKLLKRSTYTPHLQVDLIKKDTNQASLTVKNISTIPVITWDFNCSFDFVLKDKDGHIVPHMFDAQDSPYGVIAKDETNSFSIFATENIDNEDDFCELNGFTHYFQAP